LSFSWRRIISKDTARNNFSKKQKDYLARLLTVPLNLIGHLIKKRTGVSLRRIGEHLVMGNNSHVSWLCSRIGDLANQPRLSKYLKQIEARARQE